MSLPPATYRPLLPVLGVLALVGTACSVVSGAISAPAQSGEKAPAVALENRPPIGPDGCPVTRPPQDRFTPPEPYPEFPPAGQFWYGTEALWTMLPGDGTWASLPVHEDGSRPQKILWWREGYNWHEEPQPALTLTARQLDKKAASLAGERATNGFHPDLRSFMLSGADFPEAGCWEITGEYAGKSLSFVVWIAPE